MDSQKNPIGLCDTLDESKPEPVLDSFDLKGVANKILSGSVRNIVVMAGAGKLQYMNHSIRVAHDWE
jgi:hypothetical protein